MGKRWKYKKPVAVVTSVALALSLAVAPGVASARVAQDGLAVVLPRSLRNRLCQASMTCAATAW